jgi:two-component system invasion response regulator UvrY
MRILIVDDHPMVIEGCRGMLSDQPDIEILEAHNADEALEACGSAAPDVVVLDINLPGVSGVELLRRILKRSPNSKIIVFTMNDDPIFAARSIEQGARGYIAKNEDPASFQTTSRSSWLSRIKNIGDRFSTRSTFAKSKFFEIWRMERTWPRSRT